MKKIYRYTLLLLVGLLAYSVSSCDDLTGLNNDPKHYTEAKPAALFLSGQKNLADVYGTASAGTAPFRVISQIWTQNSATEESKYNLAVITNTGSWWTQLYAKVLSNLKQAKGGYAKEAGSQNAVAIVDILEVYTYYLLVNTYGDIPYFDAVTDHTPFPKYDDAKTVVLDLIHRLDADIANLDATQSSIGSADQIYGGDVVKWRKFAATLKLKAAVLIAKADAQTASAKALEAVATGVFAANSDNALFKYDGAVTGNSNNVWYTLVFSGRHDYSPAQFFIATLQQRNDPRMDLLFAKNAAGGYSGGIAGQDNDYTALSPLSAAWLDPKRPVNLLDYSEAEFLLAEAAARQIAVGGTPEEHYKKAVKASILAWGGSETVADDYLNEPSIQYATATWQEQIGYQKWIAFADRAWDAWTEIRRLGYPDIDVISPPVGAQGKLPQRLVYPSSEQTSNSVNWKKAVEQIQGGKDVVSVNLFWK
ncbi:MAG: SusD/RagB family nutrient-binding outer membrane lipoprotein [Dysgonamonadaceae bacterium]|jgi:hypothetical protein|nr:SusD/RagB family nutrient-binding outer membrane lipoprotein [Dysgonamonadaceae bacterium]